jgi:predicted nucleic acid-binding protein
MISAVDSSVLLDILIEDSRFSKASIRAVELMGRRGRLIVSPIVISEIFPLLGSRTLTEKFLSDLSIEFVDLGLDVSLLAGGIFMHYKRNKGGKTRVIADFLVGTHALIHSEALLTRDQGFYRPYFKELKIINPTHI